MRKFILPIILVFTLNNCFAQELKRINNSLKHGYTESYFVLKSDKRIKQGGYALVFYGDTVQRGFYTKNNKSGEWHYRFNKKIEFIYNHDLGKIVSDTIGKARNAFYSEGTCYLSYLCSNNIKYPEKSAENGKSGTVIVSFSVGVDGVTSDFDLVVGCGDLAINNEALRVVKILALAHPWYPATNEKGEIIRSTVKYPVKFILS